MPARPAPSARSDRTDNKRRGPIRYIAQASTSGKAIHPRNRISASTLTFCWYINLAMIPLRDIRTAPSTTRETSKKSGCPARPAPLIERLLENDWLLSRSRVRIVRYVKAMRAHAAGRCGNTPAWVSMAGMDVCKGCSSHLAVAITSSMSMPVA